MNRYANEKVQKPPRTRVTPSTLPILLHQGEGTTLEYKEGLSSSLAREFVALANTVGGHILLGVRDDGTVVPAISGIEFLVFERATPWHEEQDPDRDGVQKATYNMQIRFARQGTSDLIVAGPSTFYSVPVADKRGADRYKLLGWIDQSKPCP